MLKKMQTNPSTFPSKAMLGKYYGETCYLYDTGAERLLT